MIVPVILSIFGDQWVQLWQKEKDHVTFVTEVTHPSLQSHLIILVTQVTPVDKGNLQVTLVTLVTQVTLVT